MYEESAMHVQSIFFAKPPFLAFFVAIAVKLKENPNS